MQSGHLCEKGGVLEEGVRMALPVTSATAFFTDRSIKNGTADAIPPFAIKDHPQICWDLCTARQNASAVRATPRMPSTQPCELFQLNCVTMPEFQFTNLGY